MQYNPSMKLYDLERYDLSLIAGLTDLTQLLTAYNSISSLSDVLLKTKIDRAYLLGITKQLIEVNAGNTDTAITLFNTIQNQENINLKRMQRIKEDIRNIYFALRNSQAVDANVPTYIDQINLDFLDETVFAEQNVMITADGKIIGTAIQPNSDPSNYTNVTLDTYDESTVAVSLVDTYNTISGYVTNFAAINSDTAFTIGAITPIFATARSFEVLFDRNGLGEVNQIDMSLTQAHLIELESSPDGITFTPIFNKKVYVTSTLIPFPSNTDRYFKLIVYKNSELASVLRDGNYRYEIDFNYLFLSKLAISDTAEFITNDIDPGITSLTGFSIDTDDNYDDPNIGISYFIDFNNEDNWREIKPAGKKNITKRAVKSFINVSDYYTNQLIELENFTRITDTITNKPVLEYNYILEQDFLDSNQIRVFGNSLTDVDSTWNLVNQMYTITGILNEASEITVGPDNILYLNGVQVFGDPDNSYLYQIGPGIYAIQIDPDSYQYLYNKSVYILVSISALGVYTLQNIQLGTQITVTDPLYPYNLKTNVESTFDFLFKSELIENKDYSIYNNPDDNTNTIRTFAQWNNLYIAYRIFESDITGLTFRIKANYKSLDNVTIPYTNRLMIRCL